MIKYYYTFGSIYTSMIKSVEDLLTKKKEVSRRSLGISNVKWQHKFRFSFACLFVREVKGFDRKIEEKEIEGSNVGLETMPRILEPIKQSNLPLLFF